MFIVKTIHKDGSVNIEAAKGFGWDSEVPSEIVYNDMNDLRTTISEEIIKVFVYSASTVIFTRDLTTGKPIENFYV